MRGSLTLREPPSSAPALTVHEIDRAGRACDAVMFDFGEGGLLMDCVEYFRPHAVVRIEGKLKMGLHSMHLVSRARVVSCRRIDLGYRIGVEFLDAEYRPAED